MSGSAPLLRLRRLAARLPARLLAFNLLLVLVPIVGLFYFGLHEVLGRYERRLLDAQERSMAQQGRLLAAALADSAEGADGPEEGLSADRAERILAGLEQRLTARLRLYDRDGELLADSAALGPRLDQIEGPAAPPDGAGSGESWLYRLGAAPFRLWRAWRQPDQPAPEPGPAAAAAPEPAPPTPGEIRDALDGRYGAEARPTPGDQRSLTLHVAIPVRVGDRVIGAAQASQSTYRILEELRRVRLSFFEIFLVSLAGAALLSIAAAATIARPIRRLRSEAATLVDRRGRLRGTFSGSESLDEVGDLARTLEALSRRVEEHVRFVESFAADVSHEFKNPLTSIRAATELLPEAEDPEERSRLLTTIGTEVARMERLLSAVREISLIDSRLDEEPMTRIELSGLLRELAESIRIRAPEGVELVLELPDRPVVTPGAPERLAQVVENLVDNAMGFAPVGSAVSVRLVHEPDGEARAGAGETGVAVLTVSDRGPGIPPEHMDRIFDRFFTYRPADGPEDETPAHRHTGLGLAIVAAIVEAYGGSVRASGRRGGGAELEVRLPATAAPRAPSNPGGTT